MPLIRLNPPGMYEPYQNAYTQVIISTGATMVHVAGTVSLDPDRNLIGENDMAIQVRETMKNIGTSLAAAGANPSQVVRINIFTLDVDQYLTVGHAEVVQFFGSTLPTSTLVGVLRLADPRYLVEIQATAIAP